MVTRRYLCLLNHEAFMFETLWRRLTRRRRQPTLLTALPLPCFGVTQTQASGEVFPLAACQCPVQAIVLYSTAGLAAAGLAAIGERGDVVALNTWPELRAYLERASVLHKTKCVELDPTCNSAAGRGCITRLLAAGGRKGA